MTPLNSSLFSLLFPLILTVAPIGKPVEADSGNTASPIDSPPTLRTTAHAPVTPTGTGSMCWTDTGYCWNFVCDGQGNCYVCDNTGDCKIKQYDHEPPKKSVSRTGW